MDRGESARRRARFGRLWRTDAREKSLAHGLELEEEAERKQAAFAPRSRRPVTGRFVAIAAVGVFAAMSLTILAVMVDRYEAQSFMRDHGIATQALVTGKGYTDRPTKEQLRSFFINYRFWPRSADGRSTASVAGYDVVSPSHYAATRIGQIVSIRYNPQRLSQSKLYFGAAPSDLQMIVDDSLLAAIWVVVFGGICALIVVLAWPEPAKSETRFPRRRAASPQV